MAFELEITIFIVLLAISASFAATEVALIGMGRVRLRNLTKRKVPGSDAIARLKANPQRMITTVLIGNNLANVAATVMATDIAINMFGSLGLGIATGVVTFFILVFGDITPKSISSIRGDKIALFTAPLLETFQLLIFPVVIAIEFIIRFVPGVYLYPQHIRQFTEDDFRSALELGFEEKAISSDEKELIERVLEFADANMKDIMRPAHVAHPLHEHTTISDAIAHASQHRRSNYPVLARDGTVVGVVDVTRLILNKESAGKVGDIMQKPFFVSAEAHGMEIFNQMKEKGVRIAVVVDGDGKFEGVASLYDLLEELSGDLEGTPSLLRQTGKDGERLVIVGGDARLRDIEKELGIKFPEDERFGSFGAFLHYQFRRIPSKGDTIIHSGFKITVDHVVNNRVEKATIRKL
jgi:CBS domain containing-hemolysin-like protein